MRYLPGALKFIACAIVACAYLVGYYHFLTGFVPLLLVMALVVTTLAMRLDYTLAMSAPEDLKTWTVQHLIMQITTLTGNMAEVADRQIFIEGADAYHAVRGAFLAHIGGKPSIVLSPVGQADAK